MITIRSIATSVSNCSRVDNGAEARPLGRVFEFGDAQVQLVGPASLFDRIPLYLQLEQHRFLNALPHGRASAPFGNGLAKSTLDFYPPNSKQNYLSFSSIELSQNRCQRRLYK
jgi:hypothetical protein